MARLARLVTHDVLTAAPRDAVIRWAYRRAGRGDWLEEADEWTNAASAVAVDQDPPKLAYLLTCPWCAGVWVGMAVVVLRRVCPRLWDPVARALAASQMAGLLAELDHH